MMVARVPAFGNFTIVLRAVFLSIALLLFSSHLIADGEKDDVISEFPESIPEIKKEDLISKLREKLKKSEHSYRDAYEILLYLRELKDRDLIGDYFIREYQECEDMFHPALRFVFVDSGHRTLIFSEGSVHFRVLRGIFYLLDPTELASDLSFAEDFLSRVESQLRQNTQTLFDLVKQYKKLLEMRRILIEKEKFKRTLQALKAVLIEIAVLDGYLTNPSVDTSVSSLSKKLREKFKKEKAVLEKKKQVLMMERLRINAMMRRHGSSVSRGLLPMETVQQRLIELRQQIATLQQGMEPVQALHQEITSLFAARTQESLVDEEGTSEIETLVSTLPRARYRECVFGRHYGRRAAAY